MSTNTLERISVRTDEYIAVRNRSCVMRSDARMATWLTSHREFTDPVTRLSNALVKTFKDHGGYVGLSVQQDPETGDESVVFEVNTLMEGPKARGLLDAFLDDNLAELAGELEDHMVFMVNPTGPVSR